MSMSMMMSVRMTMWRDVMEAEIRAGSGGRKGSRRIQEEKKRLLLQNIVMKYRQAFSTIHGCKRKDGKEKPGNEKQGKTEKTDRWAIGQEGDLTWVSLLHSHHFRVLGISSPASQLR